MTRLARLATVLLLMSVASHAAAQSRTAQDLAPPAQLLADLYKAAKAQDTESWRDLLSSRLRSSGKVKEHLEIWRPPIVAVFEEYLDGDPGKAAVIVEWRPKVAGKPQRAEVKVRYPPPKNASMLSFKVVFEDGRLLLDDN